MDSTTQNTSPRSRAARGVSPGIEASPIENLEEHPRTVKTGGRPRQLALMPSMPMTDVETALFDSFIQEYLTKYPDLEPVDYRILFLAGLEYIKYLRIIRDELDRHQVISMARQHPAVQMRGLLNDLSVSRRQRKREPGESTDTTDMREFYLQVSKQ